MSGLRDLVRVTLFADHPGNDDTDFAFVRQWIERWPSDVRVETYSTGGWEHVWDIEASRTAIAEIPERFFCASEWANYPRAFPTTAPSV